MSLRSLAVSGVLADALLDELAIVPADVVASALAIALGRVAEQHGLSMDDIRLVLDSAHGASRAIAS